jgi:hypothetical protein
VSTLGVASDASVPFDLKMRMDVDPLFSQLLYNPAVH